MSDPSIPVQILNADASVSQTSIPFLIGGAPGYGVEVAFSSATSAGSLKLQGSVTGVNYGDVEDTTTAIVAGNVVVYNVPNVNYRYMKVVWTPSGGTGTITASASLTLPINIIR